MWTILFFFPPPLDLGELEISSDFPKAEKVASSFLPATVKSTDLAEASSSEALGLLILASEWRKQLCLATTFSFHCLEVSRALAFLMERRSVPLRSLWSFIAFARTDPVIRKGSGSHLQAVDFGYHERASSEPWSRFLNPQGFPNLAESSLPVTFCTYNFLIFLCVFPIINSLCSISYFCYNCDTSNPHVHVRTHPQSIVTMFWHSQFPTDQPEVKFHTWPSTCWYCTGRSFAFSSLLALSPHFWIAGEKLACWLCWRILDVAILARKREKHAMPFHGLSKGSYHASFPPLSITLFKVLNNVGQEMSRN